MSDEAKQNQPERRPIKVKTELHSRVKAKASLAGKTLEEAGDEMAAMFLRAPIKSTSK